MNAVDGVDGEPTGAWFWDYGDSAFEIRLEYHVEDLDRWKAVRDRINRDLQRAFDDAGIELAFPTRTVRLEDGRDDAAPCGPEEGVDTPL